MRGPLQAHVRLAYNLEGESRGGEVLAPLAKRAQLYVVEGGDHSLATSRKNPLQGSEVWLDVVARFILAVPR